MYHVRDHMNEWLADNGHDIRHYDLVLGVYNTVYNLPYWGYCFSENNRLATIVMRLGLAEDVVVRLMAHEIGHAFGASHDPAGTSLMSPMIDGGGSWSAKNKGEVNAFLALEKTNSYFGDCPTLVLEGLVNGMNVTLNWTATNEIDVANYVLYEDGIPIDTVEAKGASTNKLSYTYEHTTDSEGKKVYWLHQMSKWGNLLENENAVVNIGNVGEFAFGGYPNPFLDTLRVMAVEPGTKIVVYNALSQRVIEHVAVEDSVTLYTSGWTPGVYIVTNAGRVHRVIRL